jgi:hypothetical protein
MLSRSELHRVACMMVVSLALGCQAPNPNFALGGGGGDGRLDTQTDLSGGGGAGGGGGGAVGGYGGQGGFPSGNGGSGAGQGGNASGTGGTGGALPEDAPQADGDGDGDGDRETGGDVGPPPVDTGSPPDSAVDITMADQAPPPPDGAPDLRSSDTPPDTGSPPDSATPPQEGLWAYYYSDRNQTMLFAGPLLDMTVDHNWGGGPPLEGMASDNFAVKWTGVLVPKISGTYTFYTNSDDGARFKLGTDTLIDKYVLQGLSEWPSYRSVPLTAGVRYPIVAEFFDGALTARMHLSWAAPGAGVAKEIIPRSVLFTY